jgi:hypothetical protein
MTDRRNKPWPKLRVVVEVTVPPNLRATEKDLAHEVQTALSAGVFLRRPIHQNAYHAAARVKVLSRFLPAFLLQERRRKNAPRAS